MSDEPWWRCANGAGLVGPDGSLAPTIFAEMTALAASTGAVNLGQGFPDFDGPPEVLEAAQRAIADGVNQYGPGRGNPQLIEAVAEHQRRWYGLDVGPSEVLITVGATEGISATLLAYLEPGDEVVALEPYYDEYAALAAFAGAKLVPVPMTPPDFTPDPERLAAACGPRTRVILINSPHNPTGVVLDEEFLRQAVRLAEQHDAVVVTDEVYEHLVYDGRHSPVATLDVDPDRVVTISSGGKTFSTTGWKIGWVISSARRIAEIQSVKQYLSFVGGVPFQPAIAVGLGLPDEFFSEQARTFAARRDLLVAGLGEIGLEVRSPASGYFVLADASPLGVRDAASFARELPERAGVVAVPVSPFARREREDLAPYLRFAFCKRDEVIREAVSRLVRLG